MVSAFFPRSSGPGSSPGQGHCIAFLDKTLNSQTASLHLGVQMGASNFNAGGSPLINCHPIHGLVEIPLVAPCYRKQDKCQPDGPLGS